jgi:flagellar biosynthetic protein FliQ
MVPYHTWAGSQLCLTALLLTESGESMNTEAIITILREALLLVLLLSAGPMLTSLLVGLIVSILQATTQIQEQTLSYVPKLIAVFLSIAVLGPWMLSQAIQFSRTIFDSIVLVR